MRANYRNILNRLAVFMFNVAAIIFIGIATVSAKPLRDNDGTLRILAIGNSFSDDGMEYLPPLLETMGVKDVELARLYVGGCTLEQHVNFYRRDESPYILYRSAAAENKWHKNAEKVSLRYALTLADWDIIVMQQASGYSGIYETYQPYLDELMATVKAVHPQARIAWQMTWAYSTDSDHKQFADYGRDQQKMLQAIYSAVQTMLAERGGANGISTVIPSATTIQSLRRSPINNPDRDLTRDGYHMDFGAGRYALACTWYEALIEPFTGLSMIGNGLLVNKGQVKVGQCEAAYCQKAARKAVQSNFKVRNISVGHYPLKKTSRTMLID